MASMFLLVGLLELVMVLLFALTPSVRLLEDRLPNHDTPETPPVHAAPASHALGK
jgi:hypothetical protein